MPAESRIIVQRLCYPQLLANYVDSPQQRNVYLGRVRFIVSEVLAVIEDLLLAKSE